MIGVGGSFRNIFKISKMVRKYPLVPCITTTCP